MKITYLYILPSHGQACVYLTENKEKRPFESSVNEQKVFSKFTITLLTHSHFIKNQSAATTLFSIRPIFSISSVTTSPSLKN